MVTCHYIRLLLLAMELCTLAPLCLAAAVPVVVSQKQRDPSCTGSLNWFDPSKGLKGVDCLYAINRLFDLEVARHGNQLFEFTRYKGKRYSHLPEMETPRRYIHGTT